MQMFSHTEITRYTIFGFVIDTEKKVLRAAAHAQASLGAPLIIHPGRNPQAPVEINRIIQEAGGNIQKTVMSHLDSE